MKSCKCGRMVYTGISPKDCEGCNVCNTTFSDNPTQCKEKIPHQMEIFYVDDIPKWNICIRCTYSKRIK